MKCQMCGKNPATTYVKVIVNGELTEYALCSECAQKKGYGSFLYPFALDFNSLLGTFFGDPVPERTDTVRCPGCGCSFGEIAQSGKVGCAECYNTFRDRLLPSIQRIHGNTKHFGKRPGSRALRVTPQAKLSVAPQPPQKEETELERKKRELREAIDTQNFEHAAELRDEIKKLEGDEKK